MITNLTQFEWVKSELKRIFYEQYKTSGKLVILWKRILNLSTEFTSSKSESVFVNCAKDRGFTT